MNILVDEYSEGGLSLKGWPQVLQAPLRSGLMGKLDGLLWWLGYSPVCPCDIEGEPRDSGGITAI